MLAIEEALWEMHAVDTANEQGLPPGYRFHPTDEELVAFYLASKVFNGNFCGVQIAEIDLNRCEPWELPDIGKIGKREWYFFSSRDRKYPTGLRTNRATEAGYWKATGKDKEVYSSTSNCSSNASQQQLIGMKKTLVFYKGRAPRGVKTRWVMHEYRLVGHLASLRTSKEEWVICRIHHKAGAEKIRTNPLLMSQLQTYPSLSINNMITLPPNFLNCSTSTSLVDPPIPNAQNSVNHHLLLHIHQESTDDITNTNTSINNGTVPISQPHQHSLFSKIDNFQQCSTNYPSSHQSFLFKSLLSHHQDHPLESSAVAPNGSCFQQVEANNLNWMDKIQENSLFFELSGLGGWGTGSAGLPSVVAAAETDHHNELSISSSVAFNRTGFQMMLDSHISGHGKSVCLDS